MIVKEEDTHEALKIYHNMMTISGIWPKENSSAIYKLKFAISWTFALSFLALLIIQILGNLNNYKNIFEVTYTAIVIFCYMVKLACVTFNKKMFLKMIELVKDPIFCSHPKELDGYMKKAIRLSKLIGKTYQYSVLSVVIFYSFYPVIFNTALPLPLPYDFGKFNFIMYIYQIAIVTVAAWNVSSLDLMTISLIGIANAQFDILAQKIISIEVSERDAGFDLEMDEDVIRHLRQCVGHHLAILDFVDMIESIFTIALFSQLLATALIMCNIFFYVMLVDADWAQMMTLMNAFVSIQIQLFFYCWFGNMLKIKSLAIGEACYVFKWYNCGPKVRKYIFIIMERAERPSKLTALKFMDLSVKTYLAVIQWSYSGLTLLLNVYKKEN